MTDEEPPLGSEWVATIDDVVGAAEIDQIVFHEISARRMYEDEPTLGDIAAAPLQVAVRGEGNGLEVRCRIELTHEGGRYVVDGSICYHLQFSESETADDQVTIPEDVVDRFVTNVGIMAIYPYLREALHQAGSRLGLKPAVLPLLRAGAFRSERNNTPPDWVF
ncbi:hypothetical protein BOH72_23405 [Mycobacterium sp. WY10]|nr:hypothetical protein BOH72_23405 [Mycobacterium sp. WY10]